MKAIETEAKIVKAKPGPAPGFRSDKAAGSGPVFEIRRGAGMNQQQFADATGISRRTIQSCEKSGNWPDSKLARDAVLRYAKEHEIDYSTIM